MFRSQLWRPILWNAPEVAIPGLILVAVVIATSLQSYIFLMATRKLIYRIIHLYDVTASVPTNIQHPEVVSACTAV